MNEVDKFFGDLPGVQNEQSIFNQGNPKPAENAGVGPGKAEGEEGGEGEGGEGSPRKNRRHRRLEEAYQRERESNIALNERLRVLSQVNSNAPVTAGEMPPEWIALYGNTEESKNAWAMQSKMFAGLKDQAKQEALQEFESRQAAQVEEQQQFESFIDEELEALEDEYDVDLTSNSPAARKARREFLEMVEKFSPKDQNGTITAYADFGSTFETYQQSKAQTTPNPIINRQKEIAARTMQESGKSGGEQKPQTTPGFYGWRKDYGL